MGFLVLDLGGFVRFYAAVEQDAGRLEVIEMMV